MTGCARVRLPDRRPLLRRQLDFNGHRLTVSLGIHPASNRIREIFLELDDAERSGAKAGSDMDRLLQDVGVLLSHLLQRGAPLTELARGVGRLGGYPKIGSEVRPAQEAGTGEARTGNGTERTPAQPASVVGATLDLAIDEQRLIEDVG